MIKLCRTVIALALAALISPAAFSQTGGEAAQTVAGKQLGAIVIRIMPTKASPDDGYWRWLFGYVDDSERAEGRIDQIRRALSVAARQSAELRSRWMSFFVEEYGSGRLNVEPVLRKERNRIKAEIDKLKRSQRPQIDEALGILDKLDKSVQAQLKRSKDRRPELKEEAERLAGIRPFLKIELYDAAEWHKLSESLTLYHSLSAILRAL